MAPAGRGSGGGPGLCSARTRGAGAALPRRAPAAVAVRQQMRGGAGAALPRRAPAAVAVRQQMRGDGARQLLPMFGAGLAGVADPQLPAAVAGSRADVRRRRGPAVVAGSSCRCAALGSPGWRRLRIQNCRLRWLAGRKSRVLLRLWEVLGCGRHRFVNTCMQCSVGLTVGVVRVEVGRASGVRCPGWWGFWRLVVGSCGPPAWCYFYRQGRRVNFRKRGKKNAGKRKN